MSDHVAKTPEARWKHLCDRGMLSAVDVSSNKLIDSKPAWLDEARWARAKEAIQKFYVG